MASDQPVATAVGRLELLVHRGTDENLTHEEGWPNSVGPSGPDEKGACRSGLSLQAKKLWVGRLLNRVGGLLTFLERVFGYGCGPHLR